jgi:hypothetical protein
MIAEKAPLLTTLVLLAGLWACGSPSVSEPGSPSTTPGSGPGSLPSPGGEVSITSISPTTVLAGGPDLTLTVNGTKFIYTDQSGRKYRTSLVWSIGSAPLAITANSGTQITAVIPAALLATPVIAQLQVQIWFKADDTPTAASNLVTFIVTTGSGTQSRFTPTGSMSSPRSGHTATLLVNGTVLVAGGGEPSAELFDPVKGTFTSTESMSVARSGATATLISDGRVMVAGGSDSTGMSVASAELFDPAVGRFNLVGEMGIPRSGATATLLPNGKVLIAGGVDNNDQILNTAELYDPATGIFTLTTGTMTFARWGHAATLLPNGKVLVVGGRVSFSPNLNLGSAELFDPSTGMFTATGSMATRRDFHTATLLSSGKVLVLGGNASLFSLSSGELYDSASNGFAASGNLQAGREFHTATLLPNGNVLVTGGTDWFPGPDSPEATPLAKVELFDPNSASSKLIRAMGSARRGHTATLLPDGRVLVVGGVDGEGNILATAEVYR